jgi:membrane protein implicated in regulation of membrane protease activity
MIDFLSTPNNGVFLASLGVTVLLWIVEGLALAFAGTTTPSFMDFDGEGDSGGGPVAYLNAGHLPLTLFVASAAAVFGVTGLAVQQIATTIAGGALPLLAAIPVAAIAAVPGTHLISKSLGALLPKTESTAISGDDLVGREGEVTLGTGTRGTPVQVKLRDEHGQAHYVMAEPARDADTLTQGQSVLITAREGATYLAIKCATEVLKESQNVD